MTTKTIEEIEGDIFDSRDVIERVAELEALDEPDEFETEELKSLRELAEEADGYVVDWKYGETFIPADKFEDYARELAEDISGYDSSKEAWPYTFIDWTAASEALMQDYTAIEWRGITYYAR